MKPSEIYALIPAYNEEKNIRRLLEGVKNLGYNALVVDDGSQDQTVSEAEKAHAEVIISSVNEGKGAAIRKGFDWILKRDSAAVIIMDADGQHDPAEIQKFVQALDEADLVIGNRMADPKGMPLIRRWTNLAMSWLISCVARQRIPDTQCGYRALTRRALQEIVLSTNRFEVESEMLLEGARKKLKILSIPISSVYRDEISHIRPLQDTGRFFKFLIHFIFSRK